ncbi:mechanosensitive ion channel family protein [Marinilabilia salmonicolor]|jgi:small conductance mechanosensitive channel|uniref:Small conductance mechanosensitive channel n=1 Tax=Marinilabilia salmonicolor TaxID=989 RepID=A0A2T0XBQ0_9BACT|nr:mechanosensitive ion channel family protein [Marinilabilia salmonicolor]PRY96373.1 small conductance mechanosensitive channel [Marinilabilia salmonicolor]RCW37549.1 small conductance mechanosensitive channel [Marinilabilia salmonicolor]
MNELFTSAFWSKLLDSTLNWTINELPGIFILIIALTIMLRVVKFSISRLKKILLKRAENDKTVDVAEAEKRILTLTGIILGAVRIVLMTVFIIMLLSKFSIDVGPLIASAGILGLAIGFGAQELVRDYISGFFMLLEDQIRTGDVAIINGTGGLVEKIELRTISLRDFNGTVHIFQNGKISTLANMTKEWSAMVFDIGVAYKEDVDQVMQIMKEVGEDLQNDPEHGKNILEPIEIFGLDKFGDSALVIKARLKTRPITQWSTGREYRRRLKIAFDKQNIEIPFPHTTVYWGEEINPLKLSMDQKEK